MQNDYTHGNTQSNEWYFKISYIILRMHACKNLRNMLKNITIPYHQHRSLKRTPERTGEHNVDILQWLVEHMWIPDRENPAEEHDVEAEIEEGMKKRDRRRHAHSLCKSTGVKYTHKKISREKKRLKNLLCQHRNQWHFTTYSYGEQFF